MSRDVEQRFHVLESLGEMIVSQAGDSEVDRPFKPLSGLDGSNIVMLCRIYAHSTLDLPFS